MQIKSLGDIKMLDETIALMEQRQRQKNIKIVEEDKNEDHISLTVEEMRKKIREGILYLPGCGELHFKEHMVFPEHIPWIFIDEFYTECQETEDTIIFVNNEKNVGQTLIHLPEDMEKLEMDEWEKQIKTGMKESGTYVEIIKKEELKVLDYISYRTPSKMGWIYNIIYRIHKENWRVIGGGNCLEQDMDTYGRLMEAIVMEIACRL